MNITGGLTIALNCNEILAGGLEGGSLGLAESIILPFLNGTTAGLCDLKWSKLSTLAAGATETWILSALTDSLGRPVAFARVNYLLIKTLATVAGDDLQFGGAGTHLWAEVGGLFTVKSLGVEVKAATNTTGFLVTAGVSDQFKVLNLSGSNPITYRLALIGRSV